MQHLIEEAEKQFGTINGVIHAAGEMNPQTLKTIGEMEEGGIAFQRVLACEDCPQVVVCITDIYPRIERWLRLVKPDQPGADDARAENSTQYQQRPHLSNPYVPPTTELEQFMADTWQKFFGIQQVGIQDDFFELGGDSLKALQLINILNNSGLHVTVDKIFLHQTIS